MFLRRCGIAALVNRSDLGKASRSMTSTTKGQDDAYGCGSPIDAAFQAVSQNTRPPEGDPTSRKKQKKDHAVDHILRDVLAESVKLQKETGATPDLAHVQKRTQERMYEKAHGHSPPSGMDRNVKYVPFPPDVYARRLARVDIFEDDPWPERRITAENPVLNNSEADYDRLHNEGKKLAAEAALSEPRPGRDLVEEFTDACDEFAYWEAHFIDFVRAAPVGLRRTLPLLHEHYRMAVHRLIRAEKRFIGVRNALLSRAETLSPQFFTMTEQWIERVRFLYAETHKTLSNPNFDPVRMKKSALGPLLKLSDDGYREWRAQERERLNKLIAFVT